MPLSNFSLECFLSFLMSAPLSFEEVLIWRVDALKVNCPKRNIRTTGSKAELVARVFAASEMAIPLAPTTEEQLSVMEKENAKLMPDGKQLPDPLALKDGWLPERESITSWPPIFLSDKSLLLMADHPVNGVDFHERILNDYKEGIGLPLIQLRWAQGSAFKLYRG